MRMWTLGCRTPRCANSQITPWGDEDDVSCHSWPACPSARLTTRLAQVAMERASACPPFLMSHFDAARLIALTSAPRALQLFRRQELWRLLTSSLCFTTPGEALFGLVLLYQFRVFERQLGSSKFGVRCRRGVAALP
jgi:hypothetical protein